MARRHVAGLAGTMRALAVSAIATLALTGGPPAIADVFEAGGFSFSDELGGFRIVGASGSGALDDPIVVEEELYGTGPVILVIRRLFKVGDDPWARNGIWTAFHLEKRVRNRSRVVWSGFEVELQEIRDRPSVYGDGLSFDQGAVSPHSVTSDRFARSKRMLEPYDRIRFSSGFLDPEGTARFKMHITDPTPADEFFLLQNPQLLFAHRSMRGRDLTSLAVLGRNRSGRKERDPD
ncbi:MAG: hypothetical protein KDJ16_13780 [Hyphomicrobiales bacterium]|nr:hypothetical protein [Hyphomicrobiales bacterium]